jgi:tetratricopeptide (TPR) repeat protein
MRQHREPNRLLRELMAQRKLSRELLAEEICTAALRITGEPVACTARQVGRWLSGEVAWPWGRYRVPLEEVFGRPATELGFTPPPGFDHAIVRATSHRLHQEPPVLRRQFILGLGTVLALPSLPVKGRLGLGDVDSIQAAAAQLHALDDRHGGAELAAVAARYVEHVEQSARACTYGAKVQVRLHASIGELGASAGWFAFDGGQQDAARRWWDMGIRYAVLAGDAILQARIWSYMARQACDLGHGGEAVAIARVALDATRNRREPRLSALLHARVALGHSLTGERGRAGQSLMRADQQLDRAPEHTMPWLSFCGPGELAGQAALCDYHLGRFGDAADRDVDALDLLPAGFARNSFATQVSLARNHLAAGHADAALAAGGRAVDLLPTVKSPRWARHLATLVEDVTVRGPAGAGEFADRYREVAAV